MNIYRKKITKKGLNLKNQHSIKIGIISSVLGISFSLLAPVAASAADSFKGLCSPKGSLKGLRVQNVPNATYEIIYSWSLVKRQSKDKASNFLIAYESWMTGNMITVAARDSKGKLLKSTRVKCP